MRQSLLVVTVAGWVGLVCFCSCNQPPTETPCCGADDPSMYDEANPLGANAACYVCHMNFVREEVSKSHLQAKITCVYCHGLSAGHANDENIGATPPDIKFERDQVNTMCLACHKPHDIPPAELAKHKSPPICTDCHGSHKISKSAGPKPQQPKVALFAQEGARP